MEGKDHVLFNFLPNIKHSTVPDKEDNKWEKHNQQKFRRWMNELEAAQIKDKLPWFNTGQGEGEFSLNSSCVYFRLARQLCSLWFEFSVLLEKIISHYHMTVFVGTCGSP